MSVKLWKIGIVVLLCSTVITVRAQEYNWSLGVTYQPFFYRILFENPSIPMYSNNPGKFNGQAIGVSYSKTIDDTWALKAELTYAKQTQFNKRSHSTITENGIVSLLYDTKHVLEFKSLQLPVLYEFRKQIGFQNNLFFHAALGVQLTKLLDYRAMFYQYYLNQDHHTISNTIWYYTEYNPSATFQIRSPTGDVINHDTNYVRHIRYIGKDDFAFTRYLIGAIAELGFSKVINDSFLVSAYGRAGYDFNNARQKEVYELYGDVKLHNLKLGFNINISYIFDE